MYFVFFQAFWYHLKNLCNEHLGLVYCRLYGRWLYSDKTEIKSNTCDTCCAFIICVGNLGGPVVLVPT